MATLLTPRTVRENANPVSSLNSPSQPRSVSSASTLSRLGLLSVAKNIRIEYAEDRGLLDDLTAVATVQPGEDIPNSTGFLDKRLQIATGAFFAGSKPQHGLLDPGGDQVVLQRALVLEILL